MDIIGLLGNGKKYRNKWADLKAIFWPYIMMLIFSMSIIINVSRLFCWNLC
jgi:hypothetical protein